jgi:hypothetical protein
MKTYRPISIVGSMISGLVLLMIPCATSVGQTKADATCLSYEPSVVKLEGTLTKKTFPGPPNYESVSKGDRPETYWILNLERPVCVDQDPTDADVNGAQKNVSIVQLVVDPKVYQTRAGLVGTRVVVTGKLFGAITGHHHTPVLLTVATIVER